MTAPRELAEFCERVHGDLVAALWLYCGDADLANELAQETVYLVCRKWQRVAAADSPERYAHRMAINTANSHFRRLRAGRRARARAAVQTELVTVDSDGADAVAVRRAVSALPERQRHALVLRYYADLPLTEIAEAMEASVGAVKSLLHRATVALERTLAEAEREGVGRG